MISDATMRALGEIAARERDVLLGYTPGAFLERKDVEQTAATDAYFIVRDERGRLLFTRESAFALRGGVLADAQGRPVLGYSNAESALSPLHADAVDGALGLTDSMRVEADGSVCYDRSTIDPRSGAREMQRVTIGRIALARFPAGTKLQTVDTQHATAPAHVAPHIGTPGDGNFDSLGASTFDASDAGLNAGLQRLQEAYLALDALRAADKAQGGVEKTAMDLLK